MSTASTLPKYTKVDLKGKEIIYWNALGECGHITLYTVQSFKGDWIFCRRCDGPALIKETKFMRPEAFIAKFGGDLVT